MIEARISTKRLAAFCFRVGRSLRAGVDVRKITSEEARHGPSSQRERMQEIHRRVAAGDTIAEAMRGCGSYFPPLTRELVKVGERTGRLDDVLLELASHYNHLLTLRRQFLSQMTLPAVQFCAAVLIVGFVIWVIGLLSPGIQLVPGFTGTTAVIVFFAAVLTLLGSIVLVVLSTVRGWFGPFPMMLALRIPVLGGCIRTLALSRLAWTLGVSLDSGLDAPNSIRLALRSTQNPYYMGYVPEVERQIVAGREFNEALQDTGAFPEEFIHRLATAELSGTQPDAMLRLAQEYQERAQAVAKSLTQIANFVVWALVASIIIFFIYRLVTQLILQPYREAFDFLEESMG